MTKSIKFLHAMVAIAWFAIPSLCNAQGSGSGVTAGWDPDSLHVFHADNVAVSASAAPGAAPQITAELVTHGAAGECAVTLVSADGMTSAFLSVHVFPDQTTFVEVIVADAATVGIPPGSSSAMRVSWGEFWSEWWVVMRADYGNHVTHPWLMDRDLEVGYYVAGGTAVVAGGAAGGLAIAGVNPVIIGGGAAAGGGAAGAGVATQAEAVIALGGPAAVGRAIGMGVGAEAAIARTATITLAEIQQAGITLPIARWWLIFYQNAVMNGTGGAAAGARVQLWSRIVQLLGG